MAQATPGPGEADDPGSPAEGQPRLPLVDGGTDRPRLHPTFTGRGSELAALRRQLGPGTFPAFKPSTSVLLGTGGMGKTQIALEYKRLHEPEYELVWWVNAHQDVYAAGEQIRGSLQALGRELGIPDTSPGNPKQFWEVVKGALQSGKPYRRWLLIFDDVTNPEIVGQFIPDGAGHVIVTSQHRDWQQLLGTPGIEVKAFPRDETIAFLRSASVDELTPDSDDERDAARHAKADQLADTLGDMPLAAEYAAAYLRQIPPPLTVEQYIQKFEMNPQETLGQPADRYTDRVVATTWKLSLERLSAGARSLFDLLTFFGPAPIAEEILLSLPGWEPTSDLLEPLRDVLTSQEALRAAERELYRFSLIDWTGRNRVQMARVLRGWMKARTETDRKELAAALRETVLALLAATDPQGPELEQNDSIYAWSLDHLGPAGALKCANEQVRTLVINQVRRLRMRDDYDKALSLGEDALKTWRTEPDDFQTLAMSVEVAIAMRMLGRVKEAFELSGDTLSRLEAARGTDDPTYLICANSFGEDLRQQGRYEDALANDMPLHGAFEATFPADEYRVFSLRNNIALDMRCVGQYGEALNRDKSTYEQRERRYGRDDWQTLSSLYGISSSLRQLGRYGDALDTANDATALAEAHGEPKGYLRLSVLVGKSVSLRRAGAYGAARALAEDVYEKYREYAGPEHRATLVAATSLIIDRLLDEDPRAAEELGTETVDAWDRVAAASRLPDDHAPHPNALIARANLASVYRARLNLTGARALDEAALDGLEQAFSEVHPYQLIVMTNLASDLAYVGEAPEARRLGEDVLKLRLRTERDPVDPAGGVHADEAAPLSEEMRTRLRLDQKGKDTYPIRLAASANLALDLMATDPDAGRQLTAETLPKLDELLSAEHPQAIRARQLGRLTLDLEPMTY